MITHIYIGVTVFIILAVLMIKYLKGDFSYTDEIVKEGKIKNTHDDTTVGYYYHIKRIYENGRIKIIKEEVW